MKLTVKVRLIIPIYCASNPTTIPTIFSQKATFTCLKALMDFCHVLQTTRNRSVLCEERVVLFSKVFVFLLGDPGSRTNNRQLIINGRLKICAIVDVRIHYHGWTGTSTQWRLVRGTSVEKSSSPEPLLHVSASPILRENVNIVYFTIGFGSVNC